MVVKPEVRVYNLERVRIIESCHKPRRRKAICPRDSRSPTSRERLCSVRTAIASGARIAARRWLCSFPPRQGDGRCEFAGRVRPTGLIGDSYMDARSCSNRGARAVVKPSESAQESTLSSLFQLVIRTTNRGAGRRFVRVTAASA